MQTASTADEALVALPRARAAALAGVSERRVAYWAETGLVTPTVERRLTPQRPIRLYGHADLMALLVTAELLSRRKSLQQVRKIVGHLRAIGFARPLSQLRFATVGDEVYFQFPDGTWSSELATDQIVMHEVIELDELRARIRSVGQRGDAEVGKLARRRGAVGNKPVIAGTRLPVATVRRYLDRGATTEDVLKAFPVLVTADVEAVRSSAIA